MKIIRIILIVFISHFFCKKTESPVQKELPKVVYHPDTFTVAFYNVQNLFDLEYEGSEYKEYKPGVSNWDRDMMNKKMGNIASVLIALKAEVVGLCEVENENALKKLQKVLENKGCTYKYSAIADEPIKSNTCPTLISRYPLLNCRGIPVKLTRGITRNILEADMQIGDKLLKIFVNHWPSKINPESWRMKSAEALSLRLKEIPEGTDYILIGDFNSDYDDHWKITTSGGDDTQGITAMHSLLGTVCKKSKNLKRFINEKDMRIPSKALHYDLWLEISESERMSHFYKGNRQTPDHIILPPALYDSKGISYVDNSFKAFSFDGKLLSGNRPIRWQIFQKKGVKLHTGKGYSDHLPIFARFNTGPFRFDSILSPAIIETENQFSDTVMESSELSQKGWMLCKSNAELFTDTSNYLHGKSSLCIRSGAQKNNGCLARLVVNGRNLSSEVFSFNLQGSGKIGIRARYSNNEKWNYYDLNTLSVSKSGRYQFFNMTKWKKIELKKEDSDAGNLEIEIRMGKGEPFCIWID